MLKERQAGASASDLCRKHGISDTTFCTWRSKCGGMDVSDARRLKGLKKNAKLKWLLAESMLDVSTLKETWARTFDAWFAACGRDLGDYGEELLATASVHVGGHGDRGLPLYLQEA